MEEIWKEIPGYDGDYEVSNMGRVRSWKNGKWGKRDKPRILSPFKNTYGYLQVNLCKDGKGNTRLVSRLIAKAFIPNPENKPEINHKDGNKENNKAENLEWCTHVENIDHAVKNGMVSDKSGEKNGKSKLTEYDVLKIRDDYPDRSQHELADKYNVSHSHIGKIINRRSWKHI